MYINRINYVDFQYNKNFNVKEKTITPAFSGNEKTDKEKLDMALEALATINKVSAGVIKSIQGLSSEETTSDAKNVETILKKDIRYLKLSTRARNALLRSGIDSIESLSLLSKRELRGLRNVGKDTADEIENKLNNIGIELL